MLKIGLAEATHQVWGTEEPRKYFQGTEPIDGVWHSHNLDVTLTLQLSFHEGVGDHRLAIGRQEFRVVHPNVHRLSSGNERARSKYINHLENQMDTHRLVECLQSCEKQAELYPAPPGVQNRMQRINSQVVEMQKGSECQCRKIFMGLIPFSKPVQTIYVRRRAYQELAKGSDWPVQKSNVVRDALKAGIPTPRLLTKQQCLDGEEACSRKLSTL
jgi:hypothetical protein